MRKLVELRNPVEDLADETKKELYDSLDIIDRWRCAISYTLPSNPEEDYCRQNLNNLFDAVINLLPVDNEITKFAKVEAKEASIYIPFRLASSSSLPEPVLICKRNGSGACGLIASEAKSLGASLHVAFAQAVQFAGDCAIHMKKQYPSLSYQNVVVPFVVTSWDTMQFGCVYLMDHSYPVPVLLSKQLSLSCHSDKLEVARWVVALASHCVEMKNLLSGLQVNLIETSGSSASRIKFKKDNVSYRVSSKFLFKPMDVLNGRLDIVRPALCRLMHIFHVVSWLFLMKTIKKNYFAFLKENF